MLLLNLRKQLIPAVVTGVAFLAIAGALCAQTMVVDRGLPNAPAKAPGSRRAGLRLAGPGDKQEFIADDFKVGAAGENWTIDKIRTWAVLPGANHAQSLNDLYERITLTGGLASEPIRDDKAREAECECHGPIPIRVANLQIGAHGSGSPDIVFTPALYPDATSYEEKGKPFSLWQIDFQNLQWHVPGGVSVEFSVRGVPRGYVAKDMSNSWFNHGSPIHDAHRLRLYDHRSLPRAFLDETGAIKDKSIGINVQVWAHRMVEAAGQTHK